MSIENLYHNLVRGRARGLSRLPGGLIIDQPPFMPPLTAVPDVFNLTAARSDLTTVNVSNGTELAAAVENASDNTIIRLPSGNLGSGNWGGTTLNFSGQNRVAPGTRSLLLMLNLRY